MQQANFFFEGHEFNETNEMIKKKRKKNRRISIKRN